MILPTVQTEYISCFAVVAVGGSSCSLKERAVVTGGRPRDGLTGQKEGARFYGDHSGETDNKEIIKLLLQGGCSGLPAGRYISRSRINWWRKVLDACLCGKADQTDRVFG